MAEIIITYPGGLTSRHTLDRESLTLGRDPTCELPLEDPSTSRRHARLVKRESDYVIVDLGSKNGTLVNDVRVSESALRHGDVIQLGSVSVLFRKADADYSPMTGVTLIDAAPTPQSARFSGPGQNFHLNRDRLQMLYELCDRLTQVRHRNDLLEDAMDICFETLRFERGAIGIRQAPKAPVEWPVVRNLAGREGELRMSRSIVARALEHGERAIINDAGAELDPTTSIVQQGIRSALCVPLAHQDRILGLIYGDRTTGETVYTPQDVDFLAALARLVTTGLLNVQLLTTQIEKERLQKELELARRIQFGLFPKTLPENGPIHFAVFNEPGATVSGDYYDILPLDADRTAFLIADVSGEGIAAAMLMANLQAAVRVTLPTSNDLAALMQGWNLLICNNTDSSRFITVLLGVVDARKRTLELVTAGHLPAILVSGAEGTARLLELTPGFPLGVIEQGEYESHTLDLDSGLATLFCYTDGVTEAMNSKRELFGISRLRSLLTEKPSSDPNLLIRTVLDAIRHHSGPGAHYDDVTMLAINLAADNI